MLSLDLPVDPLALPPTDLPETAAETRKSRFAFHFLVRGSASPEWRMVPTTSPRTLGLGVLTGIVLLLLRNMMVAGSPLAIEPRGLWLPPALARPGAPAAQKRRTAQHGPPNPPRRRR